MIMIDWKILRKIGTILREFEKDIEQNGGSFDLKTFYEWLKEKIWTDFNE